MSPPRATRDDKIILIEQESPILWMLTEQNSVATKDRSLLDYSSHLIENQIDDVKNQLQSMKTALFNEDS